MNKSLPPLTYEQLQAAHDYLKLHNEHLLSFNEDLIKQNTYQHGLLTNVPLEILKEAKKQYLENFDKLPGGCEVMEFYESNLFQGKRK